MRGLHATFSALIGTALVAVLPSCDRARDDGVTRVEFWTLDLGPFETYINSRLSLYESLRKSEGAEVEILWVDVPFDTVDRKLIAAAAAKRAPDVVNFSDMTFARFVSLGALIDLRPHLSEADIDAYLPGARSIAEIDGALLATPWYLTTQTIIANTELLREGGIEPDALPASWSGLRALAGPYRARTGRTLFSAPLGRESILPGIMLAEGVVPFAERDGRLVADFNKPEVIAFLREWVDVFRAGDIPREAAAGGFAHIVRLYQGRQIALMNSSPNFLRRIRDEAPSVFDQTIVRPAVTGALGRTHIATMVLGVTTQSDEPAEAARFAAWMTNGANQLAFCKGVNILPSVGSALDDAYFAPPPTPQAGEPEDPDHLIAESRALAAEALRSAVAFTPALETWPDLRRAFEDRFTALLFSDSDTVERAAADIQRAWADILDAAAPASLDAVPRPEPSDRLEHTLSHAAALLP
ncbi:MAG: extracellular solute-binding protein [Planctomycetota bacterium]